MRIAVIGVYYSANLGDAVICDCVAHWIREAYPNAEVDMIDIEGRNEFEKQQSVSIRILKKRKRNLKRDYWLTKHGFSDKVYYWNKIDVDGRQSFYDEIASRQYDCAVFAGGQLFMDWLTVDICQFLQRFEQTGTPVFFNACGLGINVSERIRQMFGDALLSSNVKWLSSRDDAVSIDERYLKGKKEVISTYDPGLWAKEVYPFLNKSEESCVGLGVMYCENVSIKKVALFWKDVIRELEKRNIKWKFFCNGAIDDYNFGCYVLKTLNKDIEQYMCKCPKKPEELIQQIGSFSSIISFRLHSHIVAAALGIPAVALVWDNKLRFFYRHLKHEERCLTISDSAGSVLHVLENAQKEGYDEMLIYTQKHYARELLLNEMRLFFHE